MDGSNFICSWNQKSLTPILPTQFTVVIGFCFFEEGGESAMQKCMRDEVILTSNQKK